MKRRARCRRQRWLRPFAPNVTAALVVAVVGAVVVTPARVQAQPAPVIGPPVRLDVGAGVHAGNETTVSVSRANPLEIVAGWNDWRDSGPSEVIHSGFAVSLDGGDTWADSLLRPPLANQSAVEGDPMTACDPRTGTIWAGAISFDAGGDSGIFVARKDPGSPTFEPAVMAYVSDGADKGWMAAGPRPGMPGTTRLYVTFNEGVIWSDDMGETWTTPVFLGFGRGFLPRVGQDGTLYVGYWNQDVEMKLKRSINGGVDFTTHVVATRMDMWDSQTGDRFPGTFRVPIMLYFDIDALSGKLYAVYFDTSSVNGGNADVDLYFTQSADQGTTWSTPTIIDTGTPERGDQFFPWLEVDDDGRLHLIYYDSGAVTQNDDDVDGMFDAYYAYSVNGGDSWRNYRLSPATWSSDDDGLDRASQFIGDYLALSVADNKAYPVYLDTSAGDADIYTNLVTVPVFGDVHGDGQVGFADLVEVLAVWGPCPDPSDCIADLNGDGSVGFADLLIVLAEWGES